jgi:2-deoxy-D-gluconate 3-dehydrogenase
MAQFVSELFSVKGKTVIVTGGTGGLGKAMTVGLAQAGASIVSIELPGDPNSASLLEAVKAARSSCDRFECDLSNAKDLRQCYHKIWESGVIPDILLNCAGIVRRNKCEDATDEDIDAVCTLVISLQTGALLTLSSPLTSTSEQCISPPRRSVARCWN